MKKASIFLIAITSLFISAGWVYYNSPIKISDAGTEQINLWIPGFAIQLGANFVDKEDEELQYLLKKVKGARIKIVEGDLDKTTFKKDFEEASTYLRNNSFEELITVIDPTTNLSLQIREDKNGNVRRLAILVLDDENFIFVRLKCKLNLHEIARLIEHIDSGEENILHQITQYPDYHIRAL